MQQDLEISGIDRVQRLAPEFVSEHWAELSVYVKALPLMPKGYRNEAQLNNVLGNILSGYSSLWVVLGTDAEIKLVVLLSRGILGPEGTQVMHMEGITKFDHVSRETFKETMESMENYARSRGCTGFLAETLQESVANLAKSLGWQKHDMIRLYKEIS